VVLVKHINDLYVEQRHKGTFYVCDHRLLSSKYWKLCTFR